ncbi:uncharacterized protein LOC143447455 [Clavelina lepadiformis]|uniref:uncharacterized protein LOC143447455 n=1 Tax=Clavelina lepadiformis TaxID=159417 RepID=UPI00404177AB
MEAFILLGSVFLIMTSISDGRQVSLSLPNSIQASGSNVTVTCAVTQTTDSWSFSWILNGVWVGYAGHTSSLSTYRSVDVGTIYTDRISIRVFPNKVVGPDYNFTSELTIRQLEPSDDGLVILIEDSDQRASVTLNVKDCNITLPHGVTVESSSAIFGSLGTFECRNNGQLFYNNGTALTTLDTNCLASAMWRGAEGLECWRAPNVTLTGNFVIKEGGDVTISCDYDDTYPSGMFTRYYVGGETTLVHKGQPMTLISQQADDNNKVVTCQAVTPLTDVNPALGKSQDRALNVRFPPRILDAVTCIWFTSLRGKCDVMFSSNPPARFEALRKQGGKKVTNDGINIVTSLSSNQTFTFERRQVNPTDNGTYSLILKSSEFSGSYDVIFDVVVIDNSSVARPVVTIATTTHDRLSTTDDRLSTIGDRSTTKTARVDGIDAAPPSGNTVMVLLLCLLAFFLISTIALAYFYTRERRKKKFRGGNVQGINGSVGFMAADNGRYVELPASTPHNTEAATYPASGENPYVDMTSLANENGQTCANPYCAAAEEATENIESTNQKSIYETLDVINRYENIPVKKNGKNDYVVTEGGHRN